MVSQLLQDLKYRGLWIAVGVGLVALVVYLSLTPEPPAVPEVGGLDPGHILAYFTLMAWWAQVVKPGQGRIVLAVGFVGLGVGLEYVQALTPYRTFDVNDMRDDSIGVIAAYFATLSPLGHVLLALERRLLRGGR